MKESLIKNSIQNFNTSIEGNNYDRLSSWIYCYDEFRKARNKVQNNITLTDDKLDFLALHLGFYLASWGMMRGSSFLLQKSYKIHIPVVKEIMNSRYNVLQGISASNLLRKENLELLFELKEKIVNAYEGNHITDTLITKILLGTLGCVPAYDRFFVKTLRNYNIAPGTFSKTSIKGLCQFYIDNEEAFSDSYNDMKSKYDVDYPQMKLVDMCLWEISYYTKME